VEVAVKTYSEAIADIRCVHLEATLTTGDASYPGTAVEVCNETGADLFHFVIGPDGKREVVFFTTESFRISLQEMETLVAKARLVVAIPPEQ
jgi:hypothetical protein